MHIIIYRSIKVLILLCFVILISVIGHEDVLEFCCLRFFHLLLFWCTCRNKCDLNDAAQ